MEANYFSRPPTPSKRREEKGKRERTRKKKGEVKMAVKELEEVLAQWVSLLL